MARVTVEDCVRLVPNRFDLVLMAAQRARTISRQLVQTHQRVPEVDEPDEDMLDAIGEVASIASRQLAESELAAGNALSLADDDDDTAFAGPRFEDADPDDV